MSKDRVILLATTLTVLAVALTLLGVLSASAAGERAGLRGLGITETLKVFPQVQMEDVVSGCTLNYDVHPIKPESRPGFIVRYPDGSLFSFSYSEERAAYDLVVSCPIPYP